MKVRAKWAIKVAGEWHRGGEVFETDSIAGIKDCVEVLRDEPKPTQVRMEEAEAAKPTEAETGTDAAAERPRSGTRTRKKTQK